MQFVKTVLGERLSTVVRRRMCPDVGTFTLSLEERQKAVKKQYLLLFGLLTLLERPLFIFFFYLTGWATRAGGLVIAVLAVDALLQATGLLIWYQTGSTLAEELIITVFFYVFVSIIHCVPSLIIHCDRRLDARDLGGRVADSARDVVPVSL